MLNDDAALLDRFEQAAVSADEWHHREHIKVAYLLLCRYPFEQAVGRMQLGLQTLNKAHQVPDEPGRGYHETRTQAWMRLVRFELWKSGSSESADAFFAQHSQTLSKDALLGYYSSARLLSREAKRMFLEPDLAPLPEAQISFG